MNGILNAVRPSASQAAKDKAAKQRALDMAVVPESVRIAIRAHMAERNITIVQLALGFRVSLLWLSNCLGNGCYARDIRPITDALGLDVDALVKAAA